MSIVLKPKTYGPMTASSSALGAICCTTESGHQVSVGAMADTNASSPADLLLAALASCISISLEMVASSLQCSVADIAVNVVGTKAASLPHRIERFRVEISFTAAIDADIELLLKKTKELCTISNTLASEIELVHVQG